MAIMSILFSQIWRIILFFCTIISRMWYYNNMTKEEIKGILALAGKTQKDGAEALGISLNAFNKKVARESFSDTELDKLAEFVGGRFCKFIELPNGTKIGKY